MALQLMSALLIAGLIATGYSIVAILADPHENSLREFAVLGMFCSVLMMLSYYAELNAPGLAAKVEAVKFGYLGRVFVTPMLVVLVLRYYGVIVKSFWQFLLYIIPIVSLICVFRYDDSTLYYKDISLSSSGLLVIKAGPLYYVYMGYNLLLAGGYITFCLYQRSSLSGRRRVNNTLLIAACAVPFLALALYLAGWTNGFDVTSLGVMIGSMLVALSALHYGLLDKDEILQSMATGLVFLSSNHKLVYANKKAEQILPELSLKPVISQVQDLAQLCEPEYATVQCGTATYQRKITEWSSSEGRSGKLLTFDDITEIRARLNRDEMTGLLNHANFYPMLDDAMGEANRKHENLTVAIADIDRFKRINDNYGHANGDTVLIRLAATLRRTCCKCGEVFRYGGEEFAVIFHCDEELAESILEEAHAAFSAIDFEFMPQHVTFSFGCAKFDGIETSVALFDRADKIMYARKRIRHEEEDAAAALEAAEEAGTPA